MAFRISLMRLSNDFETIRYDHAKRPLTEEAAHTYGWCWNSITFKCTLLTPTPRVSQRISWKQVSVIVSRIFVVHDGTNNVLEFVVCTWRPRLLGVLCSEGCSGSLAPTRCWISPGLPFFPSSVHKEIQETRDVCRAREADWGHAREI